MIPFQKFNPRGEISSYYNGRLPHWRQRGCTYFVTFRLADSLPQAFWASFRDAQELWLKQNEIDPNAVDWKQSFLALTAEKKQEFEKVTGLKLNQNLDQGYGSCLLKEPGISNIVDKSLTFFHGSRIWTGDRVVMPNHVHALLTPIGDEKLEEVLQSIKGFTANAINKLRSIEGPVWSRESYDHIVRDEEQLARVQRYIRNNPAKAGLTEGNYLLNAEETTYQIIR